MASYARAPVPAIKNQMPTMLVQAKPAQVIPSNSDGFTEDDVTGILSENISSTLRFASELSGDDADIAAKFNYANQKAVKHIIEDETILQKQNASNQMRQAAVMAAVASQQKVRLSAKERLALTAKRPMTNQQINQQPTRQTLNNTHKPPQQADATLTAGNKQTSLPTLETLLAVQRQLHQHTKQHLNSLPQQVVSKSKPEPNGLSSTCNTAATGLITQRNNKPLPPSPLRSPSPIKLPVGIDTYDKDLPPLPASISPSTSTDDSQLNSLESHQSSPATSLVSIPPPPPPISSYLEQYDEVNNHQSIPSSPSTISSMSEVSSVRQFPAALQIKSVSGRQAPTQSATSFELPLPYFSQSTHDKNKNLPNTCNNQTTQSPPIQQQSSKSYQAAANEQNRVEFMKSKSACDVLRQPASPRQPTPIDKMSPPPPPALPQQPAVQSQMNLNITNYQSHLCNKTPFEQSKNLYKPQVDYNQHVFSIQPPQTPCNTDQFLPPPPPPLPDAGFDEPDSGSFRFPTPPPPELLMPESGDDDEEDFQCKIPTPPPHKSMSVASFTPSELHCHQQSAQMMSQQAPSPLFKSSKFNAVSSSSMTSALQPPPLFRQQQIQRQQQQQQFNHPQISQTTTVRPDATTPQLTVKIGHNEGVGLLSTATDSSIQHHHHHHHHHIHQQTANQHSNHHHQMMMAMTASSSSPSSSSDGDGHSTNSSSSTSGIHSSIDSPSSSSSKLIDDFDYACKLKKLASNYHSSKEFQTHKTKNITTGSKHPSPLPTNSNTITATAAAAPPPPAAAIRPALKQKKTVSFSDKVELVACADDQPEFHLPNPLLARVLAGKLQ